jgi:hypothetical protein
MGFVFGADLVYSLFALASADTPPLRPLAGASVGAGERPFPLQAPGWLNGGPPSWLDLQGKVVVVDVWAEW